MKIIWTNYFKYRAKLRSFDLNIIENILRYSSERYFNSKTNRRIVIGKHNKKLILIPYEIDNEHNIIPITVHATSRQQIKYRVKTGRFKI